MAEQLALGAWAPPYDPMLSQWHTPQLLARRMVEWAGVRPGMRVLEPSAGGGAIVRELVAAGATVEAIEVDPAWGAVLSGISPGVVVWVEDFLAGTLLPDAYDLAVMNPPLDGGEGPTHIAHALKLCPRVVSILRTVDLHGVERHETLWSKHALAGIRWLVRRPAFSGQEGANSDFVVVDVRAGEWCDPDGAFDYGWW